MPRTPPTTAPPLPKLESPESWTVQLQTITPMFGGSAQTRRQDPRPRTAQTGRGHCGRFAGCVRSAQLAWVRPNPRD